MEVTEVRVKLARDRDDKLLGFCTLTFDNCFVVRDIKIIKGGGGEFVAMPSRKLTDLCPKCFGKNHLRARFCNECGHHLSPNRAERDEKGRAKLHADIAHPIHQGFRDYVQRVVLEAYYGEVELSEQPGYQPPNDDFPDISDESGEEHEEEDEPAGEAAPLPPRSDEQRHHRFGEGILP